VLNKPQIVLYTIATGHTKCPVS